MKALFLFSLLGVLFALVGNTALRADDARQNESQSIVYAKVFLSADSPYWQKFDKSRAGRIGDQTEPLVESWVLKRLKNDGEFRVRAATRWIRLPETDAESVTLFSGWGCPAQGRIVERDSSGEIRVELSGWAPFPLKVSGQTLSTDVGSRQVAIVGGIDSSEPHAYVGLVVAPAGNQ
ncbi:MAG: hypothetical protein AAGG48_25340 [Planctomycetota bacterium]